VSPPYGHCLIALQRSRSTHSDIFQIRGLPYAVDMLAQPPSGAHGPA
jgi:hypothetical protein